MTSVSGSGASITGAATDRVGERGGVRGEGERGGVRGEGERGCVERNYSNLQGGWSRDKEKRSTCEAAAGF